MVEFPAAPPSRAATGPSQFHSSLRVQNLESSPDESFVAQRNPECIVARLGNMGSTLFGAGTVTEAADVFRKAGPSHQRVLDVPAHKVSAEAAASEGAFQSLPVFFCNFLFMSQVSHLLPVLSDVGAKILKLFVVWFDF